MLMDKPGMKEAQTIFAILRNIEDEMIKAPYGAFSLLRVLSLNYSSLRDGCFTVCVCGDGPILTGFADR